MRKKKKLVELCRLLKKKKRKKKKEDLKLGRVREWGWEDLEDNMLVKEIHQAILQGEEKMGR